MIKCIRKLKKNPCNPDFENALLDRSGDWTVSTRSLLLTGQIVERTRFSKMLKWIEKVWDLLNILAPNSKFFKRKSPCKSAFQNKLFADVSDPAGYSVPSCSWIYICPPVL